MSEHYDLTVQKWYLSITTGLTDLSDYLAGKVQITAPEGDMSSCSFSAYEYSAWRTDHEPKTIMTVSKLNDSGTYDDYTIFTGYMRPATKQPFGKLYQVDAFDVCTKLNDTEYEYSTDGDREYTIENIADDAGLTVDWRCDKPDSGFMRTLFPAASGYDWMREAMYSWACYIEGSPDGNIVIRDSSINATPDYTFTDSHILNSGKLTVRKSGSDKIVNIQEVVNTEKDIFYRLTDTVSVAEYGEHKGQRIDSKYILGITDARNVATETVYQSHCLYDVEIALPLLPEAERGQTVRIESDYFTMQSYIRSITHMLDVNTGEAQTTLGLRVRRSLAS